MINFNNLFKKIKCLYYNFDADKYIKAQSEFHDYIDRELMSGKKMSHWIWFTFPQIQGLGNSEMTQKFSLKNIGQARCFLDNQRLNYQLNYWIKIVMHHHKTKTIQEILGDIDSMKFHSSMTLFSIVSKQPNNIFDQALDLFFEGQKDEATLKILFI